VAELVPRFKEEQVFIIEAFLVHSFRESGRKGVVLGLSGGVDSALVAKLCADALGPQHVLAVAMPDGRGGKDLKDARKFAKALGIDLRIIGVAPIVTSLEKRLLGFQADQVARGNLRARAPRPACTHHLVGAAMASATRASLRHAPPPRHSPMHPIWRSRSPPRS